MEPAPAVQTPETDSARRQAAREVARRGMDMMRQERWEAAQSLLELAYAAYPAPPVAVLEGDALLRMGELTRAKKRFEAAKNAELGPDAPEPYRKAVELAEERLEALEARMPKLIVVLDGALSREATPRLTVNGTPMEGKLLGVEQSLDPGAYVVRAEVNGKSIEHRIDLREGDRRRLALAGDWEGSSVIARDDAAERDEELRRGRTVGWISLGVGGAGLATGVIAGAMAQDREEDLQRQCNPRCPRELEGDVGALERAEMVSWIGYGLGVLGTGAGAALLLTHQEPDRAEARSTSPRVRPYATLRTLGIKGTF